MEDNKARKLYDNLIDDGWQLGTYDEFKSAMSDENKRRKLHENLTEDGWQLGAYEEFSSIVGSDTPDTEATVAESEEMDFEDAPQGPTKYYSASKDNPPMMWNDKSKKAYEGSAAPRMTPAERSVINEENASRKPISDVKFTPKPIQPVDVPVQSEATPASRSKVSVPEVAATQENEAISATQDAIISGKAAIPQTEQQYEKAVSDLESGAEAIEKAASEITSYDGLNPDDEGYAPRRPASVPADDKVATAKDKYEAAESELEAMLEQYKTIDEEGNQTYVFPDNETLAAAQQKQAEVEQLRGEFIGKYDEYQKAVNEYNNNPVVKVEKARARMDEINSEIAALRKAKKDSSDKKEIRNRIAKLKEEKKSIQMELGSNPTVKLMDQSTARQIDGMVGNVGKVLNEMGVPSTASGQMTINTELGASYNPNFDERALEGQIAVDYYMRAGKLLSSDYKYDNESLVREFGEGALAKLTDLDFWTAGFNNIRDNSKVAQIYKKLDRGEEISPIEEELLKSYNTFQFARAIRSNDVSTGFKGGEGMVDMAMLALDMNASAALGGKAISASLNKTLQRIMVKPLLGIAPKSAIGKAGMFLATEGAEYVASEISDLFGKTLVYVVATPDALESATEMMLPDADGNMMPVGKALGKGYGDTAAMMQFMNSPAKLMRSFSDAARLAGKASGTQAVEKWYRDFVKKSAKEQFGGASNVTYALTHVTGPYAMIKNAAWHNMTDDPTALATFFDGENFGPLMLSLIPGQIKGFAQRKMAARDWESNISELETRLSQSKTDLANEMGRLYGIDNAAADVFIDAVLSSRLRNPGSDSVANEYQRLASELRPELDRLSKEYRDASRAYSEFVGRHTKDGVTDITDPADVVEYHRLKDALDKAREAYEPISDEYASNSIVSTIMRIKNTLEASRQSEVGAMLDAIIERAGREKISSMDASNLLMSIYGLLESQIAYEAFDGSYQGYKQQRLDEMRDKVSEEIGHDEFWHTDKVSGDLEDRFVTTAKLKDGTTVYIRSTTPNASGEFLAVEPGNPEIRFVRAEDVMGNEPGMVLFGEQASNPNVMTMRLNDFLAKRVQQEAFDRKAEHNAQIAAQYKPGDTIEVPQIEGRRKKATVTEIASDGIYYVDEKGEAGSRSWDEISAEQGTPFVTDEQVGSSEGISRAQEESSIAQIERDANIAVNSAMAADSLPVKGAKNVSIVPNSYDPQTGKITVQGNLESGEYFTFDTTLSAIMDTSESAASGEEASIEEIASMFRREDEIEIPIHGKPTKVTVLESDPDADGLEVEREGIGTSIIPWSAVKNWIDSQRRQQQRAEQPAPAEAAPVAESAAPVETTAPESESDGLPRLENGDIDYDTLATINPAEFYTQAAIAFGRDRAKKEVEKRIADLESKAEEASLNELTAINRELDKWKAVKDSYSAAQAAPKDETNLSINRKEAADAAIAAAAEGRPRMIAKYNAYEKVDGNNDIVTTVDGEMIPGKWVLGDVRSLTPSHDPFNGFKVSEGASVDENGKTVNTTDYENDKDAQETTMRISGDVDARAFTNPIIITKESENGDVIATGQVLSGNGRVQAMQVGAENGTNAKYIETLGKYSGTKGFSADDVAKYGKYAAVWFEPDEETEMTSANFARFNKSESKGQNKTEAAINYGKSISEKGISDIADRIDRFEDINAALNDKDAVDDILGILVAEGIVPQARVPELKEGDKLSGAGRDMVESVMVGSVLREEALRIAMEDAQIRKPIVSALKQILENRSIEGYELTEELTDAILLLSRAKANGVKINDTVQSFIRQGEMFNTESKVYEAAVQILADAMNQSAFTKFKKILSSYNARAEEKTGDLFEGTSKEDILSSMTETVLGYKPKTTTEDELKEQGRPDGGEAGDVVPVSPGGGNVPGEGKAGEPEAAEPEAAVAEPESTAAEQPETTLYEDEYGIKEGDTFTTKKGETITLNRYDNNGGRTGFQGIYTIWKDGHVVSNDQIRSGEIQQKLSKGLWTKDETPVNPRETAEQPELSTEEKWASELKVGQKLPFGNGEQVEFVRLNPIEREVVLNANGSEYALPLEDAYEIFVKNAPKQPQSPIEKAQGAVNAANEKIAAFGESLKVGDKFTRPDAGITIDVTDIDGDKVKIHSKNGDKDINVEYTKEQLYKLLFGHSKKFVKVEDNEELEKEPETAGNTDIAPEEAFVNGVSDALGKALEDGTKPFRSILDIRKAAKEAGMDVADNGKDDIKLQELVERAIVRKAMEIASDARESDFPEAETFKKIVALYNIQPTISMRSADRVNLQQYSTPLPMSYAAGIFLDRPASVLEPTAGNGMLTIALDPSTVHVNEIDAARLANLKTIPYDKVTDQDGTKPFPGGKKYDGIIANPPFGSSPAKDYDGKSISGLENQIALNALESMTDDGRAAIIVGGNMAYRENGAISNNVPFYTYLYDHYNVAGVIDMDGSLYAKQGTSYPTRMILINGRRSAEERAKSTIFPPVKEKALAKVNTFDELYNTVNELLNSKNLTNGTEILHREGLPELVNGSKALGETDVLGHQGELGGTSSDEGKVRTNGRGDTGDVRVTEPRREKEPSAESGIAASGEGVRESEGVRPVPVRGGEVSADNARDVNNGNGGSRPESDSDNGGVRGDGGRRDLQTDGGTDGELRTASGDKPGELVRESGRPDVKEKKQERNLSSYKLDYVRHSGANGLDSVAPAEMVESMDESLSRIEEEVGPIDDYVQKELGYPSKDEMYTALAAEQIDSVAMAIHKMKSGGAIIIGDQTGVGKGRQMAALIRWAYRQGKKPIFMTRDASLINDIYRDLKAIGSGTLKPFIFNADGQFRDGDNVIAKGLSTAQFKKLAEQTGPIVGDFDFVIASYSQFGNGDSQSLSEAGIKNKRLTDDPKAIVFRKLAKDNYLMLDESQNAAGKGKASAYMRSIVKDAAGVTFASATFSKTPDTMPLYALRTAMSKANVDANELIDYVKEGGVVLQEVMSRALARSGEMVRRERKMGDVINDWKTIDNPEFVEKARRQYNETIGIFNDIINFQRDFVGASIDKISEDLAVTAGVATNKKGTKDFGINNPPFASKTFNYTKQLFFALKVDAIVENTIDLIKKGMHPVIAVENTRESDYKDYSIGEELEDTSMAGAFIRGLEKCLEYTIKDSDGNERSYKLNPSELGEAGEKAYYDLIEKIHDATSDLFISPIDAIIERLNEAGYTVGEITGRSVCVKKNQDGNYAISKRADKDKIKAASDFNSGATDVLILNKSGATGISLHSSVEFKDQRQRAMIIAQALADVNDYMQMLGRIDRTGQLFRGYYLNLIAPIPAEQRLLMMLATKLKSLNANTTTSQDNKDNTVGAVDLLNKYGSQVAVEWLRDNPEIYAKLSGGAGSGLLQFGDIDQYEPEDDDINKITGKVALLSVEEQEQFYNDIVERYTELINYLDSTNSNDLKITVMPLKAKTLNKAVSSVGADPDGDNPFAQNTYVEEVEMDILRKPMRADDVKKTIDNINKTKDFRARSLELNQRIKDIYSEKLNKIESNYQKAEQKINEEVAKQTEKINAREGMTVAEKQKAIEEFRNRKENDAAEKYVSAKEKATRERAAFIERINAFSVGGSYLIPETFSDLTQSMFASPAIFCGYKVNDKKMTMSTTFATFAVLDGRKKIEVKLTDINAIRKIQELLDMNWRVAQQTNLDNWDSQIPNEARTKGFILTGNLLQAMKDASGAGKLISYSDIDGNVHDGILMPNGWNTSLLKTEKPISSAIDSIRNASKIDVTSTDGKVTVSKNRYGDYYLYVPKTKKEGEVFWNDDTLRGLMYSTFYQSRGKFQAEFPPRDLENVLKRLDELGVRVAESRELKQEDENKRYSLITDKDLIHKLESEPHVTAYRAMQVINGKLYPPMAANVGGELVEGRMPNEWEMSEENTGELYVKEVGSAKYIKISEDEANGIKEKDGKYILNGKELSADSESGELAFYFKLNKGGKDATGKDATDVFARYNPYWHASRSILNDQFKSAWIRPNLVTVEVAIPESQLSGDYKAKYAKDKTGEIEWKSGTVTQQLVSLGRPGRKVILSKYDKILGIVKPEKVAEEIAKQLKDTDVQIPINTVTPQVRAELEKIGVKIGPPEAGVNMTEQIREAIDKGLEVDNSLRTEAHDRLIEQTVKNTGESLGTLIQTHTSKDLKGKDARSYGWYDVTDGSVHIVTDNIPNEQVAIAKVLHETVAHKGLREVFGKDFDTFLDNIYNNIGKKAKKFIDDLVNSGKAADTREGTEEYLAKVAERGPMDSQEFTLWQRVRGWIMDALRRIGIGIKLTEKDVRGILTESYYRLRKKANAFKKAEDVAMSESMKEEAINSHKNTTFEETKENGESGPDENNGGSGQNGGGLPQLSAGELAAAKDKSDIDLLRKGLPHERWKYSASRDRSLEGERAISESLIKTAKDNSLYIGEKEFLALGERLPKQGNESVSLLGKDGETVYKSKDPFSKSAIKQNDYNDAIYEHIVHNLMFPNTRYKFEGISDRFGDEVRFVLSQKFVDAERKATDKEVSDYLFKNFGLENVSNRYYTNDLLSIYDATGDNVLVGRDGELFFIDPIISFKAPVEEIIDALSNNDKRYSLIEDSDSDNPDYLIEVDNFNTAVNNWQDRVREALIDETMPVRIMQDVIAKATGKPIGAGEDVAKMIQSTSSKFNNEKESFLEHNFTPLLDIVRTIYKKTGVTQAELTEYMCLKNGLERQVVFAQRDAKSELENKRGVALQNEKKKHDEAVDGIKKAIQDTENGRAAEMDEAGQRKIDAENARYDAKVSEINSYYDGEIERVNHEDPTQKEYKKARENEYGAIRVWFGEYYDENGNKLDKLPQKPKGMSDAAYAKKVKKMLRFPDGFDDMSVAETRAKNRVAELESRINAKGNLTDELWDRTRSATDRTQKLLHEHQMISRDQYESIVGNPAAGKARMFEHYIPMRGFAEETAEDKFNYTTDSANSNYTPPFVRAGGRISKPDSPFAYIMSVHESATASAMKNDIKNALYKFVVNHNEQGLATISKSWYVKDGVDPDTGKVKWVPKYPEITADMDLDRQREVMDDFTREMKALKETGDAFEGKKGLNLHNTVVHIDEADRDQHVVKVKHLGREYDVIFNGDPRAAQMINGQLRNRTNIPVVDDVIRFLSKSATSWRPAFWVTNFQRDLMFGIVNEFVRNDAKYFGNYIKSLPRALKVIPMYLRGDKPAGSNSKYWKMYEEYKKYGAPTGQTIVNGHDEWEKYIEKQKVNGLASVKRALDTTKQIGHSLLAIGESIEQVSRFAAFMAAKESGMSHDDAISEAKFVTLNFDQKGSHRFINWQETADLTNKAGEKLGEDAGVFGNTMNFIRRTLAMGASAVPVLKHCILFFNAIMQSLDNMIRNAKTHTGKTIGVALSMVGVGALVSSLMGDDDNWSTTSDYTRHNKFMARLGKESQLYMLWGIPQELVPFFALGDNMVRWQQHKTTGPEAFKNSTREMLEMLPLNPMNFEAPAPIQAFWENHENKNYAGQPISRVNQWNDYLPGFRHATNQTWGWITDASEWLNSATGGNASRPGWLDIDPAKAQNIIEGFGGGALSDAVKYFNLVDKTLDPNRDVNLRDFPIAARMIYNADDVWVKATVRDQFNEILKDIENLEKQLKDAEKLGNASDVAELKERPEYEFLLLYNGEYKKRMQEKENLLKEAGNDKDKKSLMRERDEMRAEFIDRCYASYFGE